MNQKTNYEAEFYGRAPVNQTNLIQPDGVLLVVDKTDFRIPQPRPSKKEEIEIAENFKNFMVKYILNKFYNWFK